MVQIITNQPSSKVVLLFLLVLFAFFFHLGKTEIDFGEHWDQRKIIKTVVRTYEEVIILPGWYNYPSLSYSLILVASLPDSISAVLGEGNGVASQLVGFQHDVDDVLGASERVRAALQKRFSFARAFVVSLSNTANRPVGLSIGQAVGSTHWVALFSASLFFSSWEMAYHAHWIAPDGLLMQFGVTAYPPSPPTPLPQGEGRKHGKLYLLKKAENFLFRFHLPMGRASVGVGSYLLSILGR